MDTLPLLSESVRRSGPVRQGTVFRRVLFLGSGLLLLGVSLGATEGLAAQGAPAEWARSRQGTTGSPFEVDLAFGVGTLALGAGPSGELYHFHLRYDSEWGEPTFEANEGKIAFSFPKESQRSRRDPRDSENHLNVRLSPVEPLDLTVVTGVSQAEIDLGGMTLRDLEITTGVSSAKLRVSSPNRGQLAEARFKTGVSSFSARELANLRAGSITVEAGVGSVDLDFGGELVRDLEVSVKFGMGGLKVAVPESTALRVRRPGGFFTSLSAPGFTERGEYLETPGFDGAEHAITLTLQTGLGGVEIRRVAPGR